ncbi:hypothetical protein F5Y10DRAFT_251783 [Nemania abortiva]|nr:hypothetical protein F5Y10DRAFT_251783 [Nemania abortiva]
MATDHVPATLSFLTDAAHLLALTSPETSAHLMSQRNSFMFCNDLDQPDVQRQRVCGCCGHVMIAGHRDLLKIESSKIARKRKSSSSSQKAKEIPPRSGCQKTLTCAKCGRYTKISIPPAARVPKRRPNQTSTPLPMVTIAGASDVTASSRSASAPRAAALSSSEPAKTSANASSKKRAKNRKQGLQALLQQSSTSRSQAGLGLSLADFMRN